jgi:hypothetical protein
MIDHRRSLDLAASSIDFDLSAPERLELDEHLASCAACRRAAEGYRADTIAIAALPGFHLATDRSTAILGRVVGRRRVLPPMRTLLIAAAMALLAAGIAMTVGAELLRRVREDHLSDILPPPTSTSMPSSTAIEAYTVDPAGAAPSEHGRPTSVAVGPDDELVVVGGFSCVSSSERIESCVTPITKSPSFESGTWSAVDGSPLDVGAAVPVSGPELGIVAVAGSGDGYVAIGYADDGGFGAAVWRQGSGGPWERLPRDPEFADARLRTVAATGSGWVIGGEVFEAGSPRAAIWTSADGRAWRRADDGAVFDIGGYHDTGEEPAAGGITDIASAGGRTVAVGRTCDERGEQCVAAAWVSDGGQAWDRATMPAETGPVGAVASFGAGFIAFVNDGSPDTNDPILVSDDGRLWRVIAPEGIPADMDVRAAARVGDGVALVVSREGRLAVLGSADGMEWTTLHAESFELTKGLTPEPGTVLVADVGIAEAQDGSAVVVGWVEVANVEPSGMQFVYRISALHATVSRGSKR